MAPTVGSGAIATRARRPPSRDPEPLVIGASLLGGLLASSCCVVQLALNSLSIGCAGFSLLRPYRHWMRLATAAMLGLLLARHGASRRTLGTVVASVLLTCSEDAVSAVNRAGSVRALLQRASASASAALLARRHHHERRQPAAAAALIRWRLDVEGMRCQACAARVRSAVASLPGVRNATVELEGGRLDVWCDGAAAVRGEQLAAAVSSLDASYRVSLAGAECFGASDAPVPCSGGDNGVSNGGGGAGSGGDDDGRHAADDPRSRAGDGGGGGEGRGGAEESGQCDLQRQEL